MDLDDSLSRRLSYNNLKRMLDEAGPLVDAFRAQYGVDLSRVGLTDEKGFIEPCYEFTDGMGHYTIDGIKASLE